jgi:hypothetical protein
MGQRGRPLANLAGPPIGDRDSSRNPAERTLSPGAVWRDPRRPMGYPTPVGRRPALGRVARVADILLALRKDIGFSDTNLASKQVLGVFINDIDTTAPAFDRWEKAKADWDQKMGWTRRRQPSRLRAPGNHLGQPDDKTTV